jgi:hypothetical protein
VEASAFKPEDYMGSLNPKDLSNIKKKVKEFLNSGENSW